MQLHSPSRYTSAPSAFAAGALPIRARRPFDTDSDSDPDPELASPTPKPPNMVRRRPLAFHFLMAKSKTPPRLCARPSGSGWERLVWNAATFSDDLYSSDAPEPKRPPYTHSGNSPAAYSTVRKPRSISSSA